MSFASLNLLNELQLTIRAKGYNQPTAIQQQAIPVVLNGQDVIAIAQTGTGKTASFTLPLLHRLSEHKGKSGIRALILAPTRELAAQIHASVQTYGENLSFKSTVIYGGVSINPQISILKRGIDILVATPGRLLDLLNQKALSLSSVEYLVLDEADRMLDMGFIHDIRRILKLLPKQRQNLLFSATFSENISLLAKKFLHAPVKIQIEPKITTAERVDQVVYPVNHEKKRELLSFTIGSKNWRQVLVFVRTKHGANRLSKQLALDGLTSSAIHGNKSQGARTRALEDFKQGKVRVLVATDIAARGLDIDKLPYVVNFDLPAVPEDYVHRVGRTGRASSNGLAISLVSHDEKKLLNGIEKLIRTKIPQEIIAGYEPKLSSTPTTIPERNNRRRRRMN